MKKLFETAWAGSSRVPKKPPVDLFATGRADQITEWLVREYNSRAAALGALNYFIGVVEARLSDERRRTFDEVREQLGRQGFTSVS